MDINTIIEELLLFSNKVLSVNDPVSSEAIPDFERTFNVNLPADYKAFLMRSNGISLMGTIVYGIGEEAWQFSLEKNHKFEHEEVGNPMYGYLVPFSPDGFGNHYCFDTRIIKNGLCNIVFWQHDCQYSEEDPPEVTNGSFTEWLKEVVIDWTLEDYDYAGNEK